MAITSSSVQQILGSGPSEKARLLEIRLRGLAKGAVRPSGAASAIFLRSLSLLLACGVRMNSALSLLGQQGDDMSMRLVAQGLSNEISRGNPLSIAMHCYPQAFSPFQVALVKVGERTGNLERVLVQLADNEEKAGALTMKVKSALTYPCFVFIIGMMMVIFGPPYLFGGIIPILKSQGQQLPWITNAFIAFSDGVRNPFMVVGVAVAVYLAGRFCIRMLTLPGSAYRLRKKILETPFLGRTARTLAVARCANSFALQMEVGCDIVDILRSSASASQDIVLQSHIEKAVTQLTAGRSLTDSLGATEYFPSLFLAVLKVGEETGEVAPLMRHLTEIYEQEVDGAIDTVVALLEPLIMAIMGSIVALMLLAVMLPMSKMISNL